MPSRAPDGRNANFPPRETDELPESPARQTARLGEVAIRERKGASLGRCLRASGGCGGAAGLAEAPRGAAEACKGSGGVAHHEGPTSSSSSPLLHEYFLVGRLPEMG